ncbi:MULTISPECIES: SirB1 family protein [Alteromonadaceae]|uniref:SirB1 family protein n=1 Tax=Alteromonadaceae TaxID=72275 RepID=UPI001C0A2D8F|nr:MULTISPECIES: tetratricopeptide repeat protein [unclassified Aliiglaciecola]MBU2880039.1 tetratricopeptide repeat protein [Aliiglaciecola lipolytica]MDO6710963.1 tetratricopeptide repeat protein [Aliiglaciecola sp. 2_MG-2023]MDO6752444.1 tetratricopeptide repeat protein [Aliiglaciecola sp. 1_MG-2023]
MKALHHAINEKDSLLASLLLTQQFGNSINVLKYVAQITVLAKQVAKHIDSNGSELERFQQLIDGFYTQLAFSGDENNFFNAKYSLVDQVIDYHTGIPVTLSIVFSAIANQLGFNVAGVNFPGHFLIRFQSQEKRLRFIDPLNGNTIKWQELEALYFSIVGETEDEEMPSDTLNVASTEEILVRLLHNLKASYIREENYQMALRAVDLLIELCPDDPYERRDRGFLLHQLECPQVAKADYQFFIKRCPQDPSAQLLKMQMRHWESALTVVLH